MTVFALGLPIVMAAALAATAQQTAAPSSGAETFDLKATVSAAGSADGALTVPVAIQIDRYTPDHARTAMADALKHGGYPAFLQALRKAPVAGHVEVNGRKVVVRWARQEPSGTGRTISFVTETPVFFVGGGKPGAKPTKGYEVAVVQLTMDNEGHGGGTMAAAARVRPGGATGVQIDDYAETPVKLTAVVRAPK